MPVMPPPSTYKVGGPSTAAAEGHSLTLLALGVHVPPSVIKDLCTRMGNLEYGHGKLVKKVITVSDAEVADGIAIGEIGPRVSAVEGQDQQATAQRDEVIFGLSQQVQTLQAVVQDRDLQIQQLSTLVAELSSSEGTLMQCILGFDRCLADMERRPQFPRWVEAKVVSSEVESEKWRRLILHQMCVAIDVATDGREEDFFPQNEKWW
ncbi:hypothetical protein Tco_1096240 [Tanacetum coccineum]